MTLLSLRLHLSRTLLRLWTGRHLHWAVWIFGLAFVLRAAWIFYLNIGVLEETQFGGRPSDEVFYFGNAQGLAQGDGYQVPWSGEITANWPPGYPVVLALLFVLFGSDIAVARLFNVFLGAITAVMVYALATKVQDQRTGIVAGFLMALFPSQIFFSMVIMTETFFVALSVGLMILLVAWFGEKQQLTTWRVLVLGLLLGFMSLVRAEAVLLGPALVILWKLVGHSWGQVLRFSPLLLAGMVLVISPWTTRNYIQLEEFVLLRGSGEDISRVIRRGIDPGYDERPVFGLRRASSPSIGSSLTHYSTHPWDVANVAWRKIESLYGNDVDLRWTQVFYDPPLLSSGQASWWSNIGNSYYFTVGLVALLGAPVLLSLRDRRLMLILWFAGSWSLFHLALAPTARYHYPVIPIMCVLAALVLVSVWERVAGRRRHLPAS